ncbi:MAG: Mov34/MPN/PAD-1 family protein [Phycisphaerales bacterium]|nr:Mov34/MPN/PAD-1 family protein [Phycisphaerales bacterium]
MDLNSPSQNSGPAALDSTQFDFRALPEVAGRRKGEFQAIMRQSVLDEIHTHGQSSRDAEVCGVLVGMPCRDDAGPYLHVEACIRGENATSASANVTFTAETWTHIQAEMDRLYPDRKIVGWYHTHPGFGIFLSGMDLFIHQSFFDLPWQVAFVYDPLGGDEGSFVWDDGKPVRKAFLVQSDKPAGEQPVPVTPVVDSKPLGGKMGIYIVILILLLVLALIAWTLWMLFWMGGNQSALLIELQKSWVRLC